jgi:ubiquinone/menaquinone biosynthesis C-methylase UbiE
MGGIVLGKKNSNVLFNMIAPIYGLFYNNQKEHFLKVVEGAKKEFDVTLFENILDVGCGTGALCSVLDKIGMQVTGIDPAEKMLSIAKNKLENKEINFVHANVLERLPFADKSFDLSIASYVAHGMQKDERKKMYAEMSRVSKSKVIIYDYNRKRSFVTSIIEWLEGGDYFRFIESAELEMKSCVSEMKECFSEVKVIDVDVRAAWYICTPRLK